MSDIIITRNEYFDTKLTNGLTLLDADLANLYSSNQLQNREYLLYKLVLEKNKFKFTTSLKFDLLVIKDVYTNEIFVTSNSVASYFGFNSYYLKEYEEYIEHKTDITFNNMKIKRFMKLDLIKDLVLDLKTWENQDSLTRTNIDISSIKSVISSISIYDLLLRTKDDHRTLARYLGLPTKYLVSEDLVSIIKNKMYDEYKFSYTVDKLKNLTKDKDKISKKLDDLRLKYDKMINLWV